MNNDEQQSETPAVPPMSGQAITSSHVTNLPPSIEGQNYNPQLRAQMANEPGVTHVGRPIEPASMEISDDLQQKHEESKRLFPDLNLSKGEYVLMKLQRHPLGLLPSVGITTFLLCLLVAVWIMYPVILENDTTGQLPNIGTASVMIMCLGALVGIFGYIAVWIYQRNTFFLTNESVIQEIQHSLFSKHEQTVSLGSIEDVSFRQTGLMQTMFNYGTIRLSTEGEETTYRFHYVANPKHQVAILNNAVEDFKNGRPVTGE